MTDWTDSELNSVGGAEESQISSHRAEPDAHPGIDAAYQAKYDRYGPGIVNTVVGEQAVSSTLRLLPAD